MKNEKEKADSETSSIDKYHNKVNDDDNIDEASEYEHWKLRELRRIKRDKDARGQL